jgi:steroid 5-alpha reductase family enzyme
MALGIETGRGESMSVDVTNLLRVVAASTAVVTGVQAATAVAGLKRGRRDYADVAWGPGLAAVACTSAVVGSGDPRRRWTLAATTTGWAIRLGRLILDRIRDSDAEDTRYTEFLEGDSTAAVVTKVFAIQGLAQLLVSAPIQLAAASQLPRSPRRWLFPVGLAVMVAGVVVEATADRQKTRFMQRDRDDRPAVLDTGLWGWSRHPNYLGDSVVWDGAWIAAAASAPGTWTAPAPVVMTYLLVYATGAKRTERRMQERPAYRDYQRQVAFFLPRPPRAT